MPFQDQVLGIFIYLDKSVYSPERHLSVTLNVTLDLFQGLCGIEVTSLKTTINYEGGLCVHPEQ